MPESRFGRRNRHEDLCLFQAQPGRPPKPRFFYMVSVGFGWRFTTVTPSDIHAFHPGCVGVAFVLTLLGRRSFTLLLQFPFRGTCPSAATDHLSAAGAKNGLKAGRTGRNGSAETVRRSLPAPAADAGGLMCRLIPFFFSGLIDPDFLKDGSCSLFSRLDTRE